MTQLLNKIKDKSAKICIVGMGYVGLPLALTFSRNGYHVNGFDINEEFVEKINNKITPLPHLGADILKQYGDNIVASSDVSVIGQSDCIIICVPTPLCSDNLPDLSYVINTVNNINQFVEKDCDKLIVLESTTYPGTTEEEIIPIFEQSNITIGKDLFIGYSPEREDPGNVNFETSTIPKVCAGHTQLCQELVCELYKNVVDTVVPVSNIKTAEMTKIMENVYRSINIGLVNEMKIISDGLGIDIFEVIDAAKTKPFGYTAYYPGPGLGGHCIPIDPLYLTYRAGKSGIETKFIDLAFKINKNMPNWVVDKVKSSIGDICGKNILVCGLAYKKNIDDCRETPSADIIKILSDNKANVGYYDPYVPEFPQMRKYQFDINSIDFNPENIKKYDCVIICTDHDCVDYDLIINNAKIVIDTRGVYKTKYDNLIKA